jgi:hypothetical protein
MIQHEFSPMIHQPQGFSSCAANAGNDGFDIGNLAARSVERHLAQNGAPNITVG